MRSLQNLKIMSALCASLVLGQNVSAAIYKLDTAHSSVGFSVSHMMIGKTKGKFNQFEGQFDFDEKTKTVKDVDIKIAVASVDTDNKDRDDHLRSPDFFNVKDEKCCAYMTFKVDKPFQVSKDPVEVTGMLTIRGKTLPVKLKVEFNGSGPDMQGKQRVGFSASTKIDRKEYGVSWSKPLADNRAVVGNEVSISIEGEAIMDAPAAAPAKK